MWVELTKHLTDDTGRFFVRGIRADTQLLHCIKNTAMDGLQPITRVRQGACHDHAHSVIQIGLAHLGVNIYLLYISSSTVLRGFVCHIFSLIGELALKRHEGRVSVTPRLN